MTSTQIITNVAIGPAGSDAAAPAKLAFGTTVKEYTLELIVTNGPVSEGTRPLNVELRYVTSNTDLSAAAAAQELALHAHTKTCSLKTEANGVTHITTCPHVPAGAFLYAWISHPNLPAAATVSVYLNEVDELGSVALMAQGSSVDASITSWSQLAAIPTVGLTPTVLKIWRESATGITHISALLAGTDPTDTTLGIQRPVDYLAGANEKVWYES